MNVLGVISSSNSNSSNYQSDLFEGKMPHVSKFVYSAYLILWRATLAISKATLQQQQTNGNCDFSLENVLTRCNIYPGS